MDTIVSYNNQVERDNMATETQSANPHESDDLHELNVLRMMATPSYIIARYNAALEESNIIDSESCAYKCNCNEYKHLDNFHHGLI